MTPSVYPVIGVALWIATASASLLGAETRPHYRTYRMGDDLLTISRQIGVPAPSVALLPCQACAQELTWRAQYVRRGAVPSDDPVARLVFSFYDDQLFRIAIDYAPSRTEGMTEADMVAAVSQIYGPPRRRTQPSGQVGSRLQQLEDTVIAEWTYGAHHVSLLAVAGPAGFRMIVASAPLEALALAAGVRDAPAELRQRTIPHADVERTISARQTTRQANVASFVP